MAVFPDSFVERVVFASDLLAIIGEDTALKRSGATNYMGLCPFPDHAEKTASFSVSEEKQVYHCFGCGRSGNIFTYLREMRGLPFAAALETLAREAGLPLPQKGWSADIKAQTGLRKICKKAALHFQENLAALPRSHKAWAFLKGKGFSEKTAKEFGLGYAQTGNALFKSFSGPQSASVLAAARQLGLLRESPQGAGGLYDGFRGRLMFPIFSHQGEPIGFGGRALGDPEPKYINSKESKIFHKGHILYGLDKASPFIRRKGEAVIVEGYTDFISLWERGVKNIAAVLGTALTAEHARALRQRAKTATLLFDGDEAGERAALSSLIPLLSEGLDVKWAALPKGADPCDFVSEHGAPALQSLIASAKPLFFKALESALREEKEGGDRFYAVKKMAPLLKAMPQSPLRRLYEQRLLDMFGGERGIMERALRSALQRHARSSFKGASGAEAAARAAAKADEEQPSLARILSSGSPAERLLFSLCVESAAMLKKFIDSRGLHLIKGKGIRDLFLRLQEIGASSAPADFKKRAFAFVGAFSDGHKALRGSHQLFSDEERGGAFDGCLQSLIRREKQKEASLIVARLRDSGGGNFQQLEKALQLTKQRLLRRH